MGANKNALDDYSKALSLNSNHYQSLINRGAILKSLGQFKEALQDFIKAGQVNPLQGHGFFNASLILLAFGQFSCGWQLYENRWKCQNFYKNIHPNTANLWLGNNCLQGKKILIHHEQGFGDTIQFIRYLNHVTKKGAEVSLEIQPELFSFFSKCRSLPKVNFVDRSSTLQGHFDFKCPLMSLPFALGVDFEPISEEGFCFEADRSKVKAWSAFLPKTNKPKIGLVWSGNASHPNNQNRSIQLDCLASLIDSSCNWIGLQKDISYDDRRFLASNPNFIHLGDKIETFEDTATILNQLDGLITVDTAIAHLAGSLGLKTAIILPFVPDFRWLLERDDSPWYPSISLFRQMQRGDWTAPIARLRKQYLPDFF